MADSVDKAKHILHDVEHPIETAKALEHEAEEGASPRTPLIVISGITLFLVVIFVILMAIVLTLYFVTAASSELLGGVVEAARERAVVPELPGERIVVNRELVCHQFVSGLVVAGYDAPHRRV
jgi:hypothetical protein